MATVRILLLLVLIQASRGLRLGGLVALGGGSSLTLTFPKPGTLVLPLGIAAPLQLAGLGAGVINQVSGFLMIVHGMLLLVS